MISGKNLMLSSAVSDLGLGDSLRQQLSDAEEERKRKLLQQSAAGPFSEATRTLFPGT